MGELIEYFEKKVEAKGLKVNPPNEEKVKKYFFKEDYKKLSKLKKIKLSLEKANPTLFYPGAGPDILNPLKYTELLFPKLKQINFIFNDFESSSGIIKTTLDEVGISFEENKNNIRFYWNDLLVTLDFIEADIFNSDLPEFDIYFEKAFRIMKDQHKEYEQNVYDKLPKNGIIISDSGFKNLKLKKQKAPKQLSAYNEMIIAVK